MEKEQIRTILKLIIGLTVLACFLYWVSPGWKQTVDWRAVVFEALFFLFVFIWNVAVLDHWKTSRVLCVGSLLLGVGGFADVYDEFLIQPGWVDWYLEDPAEALGAGLIAWGMWLGVKEKEQLLEQLQKERDFEASVVPKLAHDLRVPLGNVLGMVGRLEKDPRVSSDSGWREGLYFIWRGLKGMNLLMENILETHRLKSGTAELKPTIFALAQLLNETSEDFYYQAENKAITIVKDCAQGDVMLTADRIKVMRILQNLLDNAIKFSFNGGKVTLKATAADGDITVRVMDEGPGLAPDQISAIMQGAPITTKREAEETSESFGIGLKVVREFVQLHRGRFWIEPNSPTGAQFCFTLPRNPGRSEKPL